MNFIVTNKQQQGKSKFLTAFGCCIPTQKQMLGMLQYVYELAGRIKKLSQEGNHVIAWFLLKFSLPTHALLLYGSLNFPLKNDASAACTVAKVIVYKSLGEPNHCWKYMIWAVIFKKSQDSSKRWRLLSQLSATVLGWTISTSTVESGLRNRSSLLNKHSPCFKLDNKKYV